jgi:hypothetical protein
MMTKSRGVNPRTCASSPAARAAAAAAILPAVFRSLRLGGGFCAVSADESWDVLARESALGVAASPAITDS